VGSKAVTGFAINATNRMPDWLSQPRQPMPRRAITIEQSGPCSFIGVTGGGSIYLSPVGPTVALTNAAGGVGGFDVVPDQNHAGLKAVSTLKCLCQPLCGSTNNLRTFPTTLNTTCALTPSIVPPDVVHQPAKPHAIAGKRR